jgi:hypothetical protein
VWAGEPAGVAPTLGAGSPPLAPSQGCSLGKSVPLSGRLMCAEEGAARGRKEA